jgi:hypothetical protein
LAGGIVLYIWFSGFTVGDLMAKKDYRKQAQSLEVYFFDNGTGEPSSTSGFSTGSQKDVEVWMSNAAKFVKANPIGKVVLLVRRDLGSANRVEKRASIRRGSN